MKILHVARHDSGGNDLDKPLHNQPSARTRFWSRVDRNGPICKGLGRCWIWLGRKTRGYGIMRIGGAKYKVHRISWLLHNGRIPDDLRVLHRCDNPACVNPGHLFIGTDGDNVRDASVKGRISRGEGRPAAKLTEEDVRSIRRRYVKVSLGHGNAERLAKEYGVSRVTIKNVFYRRTWRYLK